MNINIQIPNIFKFLGRRKQQTNPDKYINSEVTTVKSAFNHPRFNRRIAVNAYEGYWAAAIDYNSNAAASGIIRLHSKVSKNGTKCIWNQTKHTSPYQRNYFSNKLIDLPSNDVQYKLMDSMEDFEIVQGHPITDLFRRANPTQSTYQLFFNIYLQLEITGDAFIHVVSFEDGTPAQLYVVSSQFMTVVPAKPGSGQLVSHYTFEKEHGNAVNYSPDEIVHIKYPSPKFDGTFYGMGKIEKGWDSYLLNKFSMQYQVALYQNKAVPDYLLINKSGNSINKKRFFKKMTSLNRGPQNAGKVMAIDGDVSIEKLSFLPKDLSDVTFNITQIASISGCPINKLTGGQSNSLGGGGETLEQNTSWLRNTILPMQKLVASALSENLLFRYGITDGDAFLSYDNPVPEDMEEKRKSDETYSKIAVLTTNEIRMSLGKETLGEEFDVPYFNGNRVGENKNNDSNNFIPEKSFNNTKKEIDTIIRDVVESNKQPINLTINNISELEDNEVEIDVDEKILQKEEINKGILDKELNSNRIANRIKDIN